MVRAGRRAGLPLIALFAIAALAFGLYWQFGRSTPDLVIDYGNANTVALGMKVYAAQCAACHGANLEGQANWRERRADGRLPAPPHDPSGHTWHHGDRQLFELTKFGPVAIAGGGYQSDMPGYENELTDREILAVLAFIKASWPQQIRARHDEINRRARN